MSVFNCTMYPASWLRCIICCLSLTDQLWEKRRYGIDSCVAYLHDQVPARAAAAAAVARAIAGLPPHQRYGLSSSSEELSSIYGSGQHGQEVEEIEEEFCEEVLLITMVSMWDCLGLVRSFYCRLL